MKNIKKLSSAFLFLLLSLILFSCNKDDENKSIYDNSDSIANYDVFARFKFSSGEELDFKGSSILDFPTPFLKVDNLGNNIITTAFEMTKENLVYRLDIKALINDEPQNYQMYKSTEENLESQGFYIELTVKNKTEVDSEVDLYRTKYTYGESGDLTVSSLTNNRLKASFNAEIPFVPLQDDKSLSIRNGEIDMDIMRVYD